MRMVKDLFGDDPKVEVFFVCFFQEASISPYLFSFQRYSSHPNVTVAPHVRENKQILEQAISESRLDGPPPTAHASPGGIRDKSVQSIVQRKPALNECESCLKRDRENDKIPLGHCVAIILHVCAIHSLKGRLKRLERLPNQAFEAQWEVCCGSHT